VLSRDQYCGSITKEKLEGEFHLWNKQDVGSLASGSLRRSPLKCVPLAPTCPAIGTFGFADPSRAALTRKLTISITRWNVWGKRK
jgi:hypothetical protein